MKGLMLKDYYLFIKRCKQFLFIIAIFTILSIMDNDSSLFIMYPCVIVALLPMTLISYDERDKWEDYAFCLPYSKREMVVEKYLVGLIINVVMVFVIALVKGVMQGTVDLNLIMTLGAVSLLTPAVMLPFIFKFGVEKGRIAYYVVLGVFFSFVFFFTSEEFDSSKVMVISQTVSNLILLGVSTIFYAFSMLISVRFFERRKR